MTKRGKRHLRPGPTSWGKQRAAADMSLRDLEAATGIHRGLLSMIEHGRYLPSTEEAGAILAALGQAGGPS